MKAKQILLAVVAFAICAVLRVQGQGYLVPNGVTFGGYNPVFGSIFNVRQNATNPDYTGFFLKPQGSDTFQYSFFADEGVRTFLVSPNAPVSLQAIQTAGYTELLYPNTYVFTDGVPLYVGLYTGYNPQNGIYENPMFGWAQLVNNAGVIQLLDSALAANAGGIYTGTQNLIPAVPEPGVLSLVGLGLLGLGWHLRRTK